MSTATTNPSAYTPRYTSLLILPLSGPSSPLSTVEDVPDSPDQFFGAGTVAQLSEEQKRVAAFQAETKIDLEINNGDPIDPPIPPALTDCATLLATANLLMISSHPATALGGEDVSSTEQRLSLAREYRQLGYELLEELDEDEDVSGDDDSDRTHGGFARAVTPGSNVDR